MIKQSPYIVMEKDIPIPEQSTKYPKAVKKLLVGYCFSFGPLYSKKDIARATTAFHGQAKALGYTICTRTIKNGIRVWRVK